MRAGARFCSTAKKRGRGLRNAIRTTDEGGQWSATLTPLGLQALTNSAAGHMLCCTMIAQPQQTSRAGLHLLRTHPVKCHVRVLRTPGDEQPRASDTAASGGFQIYEPDTTASNFGGGSTWQGCTRNPGCARSSPLPNPQLPASPRRSWRTEACGNAAAHNQSSQDREQVSTARMSSRRSFSASGREILQKPCPLCGPTLGAILRCCRVPGPLTKTCYTPRITACVWRVSPQGQRQE